MAGRRFPAVRLPRGLALWATLCTLLTLGMATTLADLARLPTSESRDAYAHGQRMVIDPVTGNVSLGTTAEEATAFEVEKTPEAAIADAMAAPADEIAPPAQQTLPTGLSTLRTQPLASDANATPRGHDSLVMAPAPEITEIAGDLLLPRRSDTNITPADIYGHAFVRKPNQFILSIVVTQAGLDPQTLPMLRALPPEVSIGLSPYTRDSKTVIETLRNTGHEVWTMLPTSGARYPQDDPGPMGLIGSMPKDEITRRLHTVMSAIPGSVGFILPPDETFSNQHELFAAILEEINTRGLYVLSTHPTHAISQFTNSPTTALILHRADILLDPTPNEALIQSKLAGLLDPEKSKTDRVIITTARPQTLELLRNWLSSAKLPEGTVLAPVSALYEPAEKSLTQQAEEKKAAAEKDKSEAGGHH